MAGSDISGHRLGAVGLKSVFDGSNRGRLRRVTHSSWRAQVNKSKADGSIAARFLTFA
jgi:hypothetical protein